MKFIRTGLISVIFICLVTNPGRANEMQNTLRIQEVFQHYGKKKNVKMVELSYAMLKTYNLTHYKSIVIEKHPEALGFVRQRLEADQKSAKKVKEVTVNGEVASAYYQLENNADSSNRFILFKVGKREEITLIYIEGEITLEDLIIILSLGKDELSGK